MTDKLPDNGGYVAAAYLVFLALLLIYFAIMAIRLSRLDRDLGELTDLAERLDERDPEREHVA
jgi:hypothetical protein